MSVNESGVCVCDRIFLIQIALYGEDYEKEINGL